MQEQLRDEASRGFLTRRRLLRGSGAGAAAAAGVVLSNPASAHAAAAPGTRPQARTARVRQLTEHGSRSAATMSPTTETWISLTLTADTTVTVTPVSGGTIRYFLTQVLGPDGSMTRVLYQNSSGSSWDPTHIADLGVLPPFAPFQPDVLLPPVGMPGADVPGHGLFPLRSRLRYPRAKPLAVFHSPTDFTSVSGSGASMATTDPDPMTPQGSPLLAFSTVATKSLAQSVDLSSSVVRFPVKIPGNGSTRAKIQHGYFEASSDGFGSGNYSHFEFVTQSDSHVADTCWGWAGAGPAEWTAVGNGASLASVNAIRFNLIGSSSVTCSLSHADAIPNNPGGRPKCVIWFDDSYISAWSTGLAHMAAYGFPGTIAAAGAVDAGGGNPSSLTSTMLRYLTEFHGWQCAAHYYFPNDGADPQCQSGPGMECWIMRSRHMHNAIGTTGHDDYAYRDTTHMTVQNAAILRKYFRTCRKYEFNAPKIETLPPVDAYAMWAYASGSQDVGNGGVNMMAYVDKAIAHNGLAQFAFENLNDTSNPQFTVLLDYLDSQRAQIDVVTLAEAIEPWTVAP